MVATKSQKRLAARLDDAKGVAQAKPDGTAAAAQGNDLWQTWILIEACDKGTLQVGTDST